MSDLDIIAQLEKRIGKKLEKPDKIDEFSVGYQLNAQQRVIGLSLHKCELKEFPREICQLQQLQTLGLWRNQLTELPAEIGQLQRLQSLNLSSNQFAQFPKKVIQLRQLQTLDLSENHLKQLPEEIGQLQQLQELDLGDNELTQLPKEIVQLQQLKKLSLWGNQLTELPEEIGQLQQLQNLGLSYNQLTELSKEICQLQQLQELDLSYNQLTELPEEIGQLQQLQNLGLSYNQLTELPEEIGQLQQLQTLWLWGNQLKELPEEIGQLQQLHELYLGDNEFTELPKEIGQLQQLQGLYLGGNEFIELPKEIGQLQQLQVLSLVNNDLTELPKEIGQLQQLQGLYLGGNEFTELPKEIGQLQQLQVLSLVNNDLSQLPKEIGQLQQLKTLKLSGNLFEVPPVEIVKQGRQAIIDYFNALESQQDRPCADKMSDLDIITQIEKRIGELVELDETDSNSCGYQINTEKQVISLDINGWWFENYDDDDSYCDENSRLTIFPKEICQLRYLQELDLSDHRLTQLPKEIGQLQQLRILNLSDNQLTQLPKEICQLQQLEILWLSRNQLTKLPKEIGNLKKLSILSLGENQLRQLPKEIGQLGQLQKLDLDNNQLIHLPKEIAQLGQLQKLWLSGNQLTQLPKEIEQLKQLQSLGLWNNQLIKFPKELLKLDLKIDWAEEWWKGKGREEGIHVKDNSFQIPPVEIVKQGRQAIIDYYDALEKTRPLNELKLLLVGDGGAGKTSLMKRLSGQPFDRAESQTHGINLNTVEMTVPALDNATVKLHCWDFGGQEIMHATHQFFLTKRSLYLVVLDARRETKTDYWLKQIQQVSDNAPVIIVMNKIDENSHFDLPRDQLKKNFPNIKQFCKISCATDAGLTELMTAIQHTIPKVELVQTPFPASWWQVKTAIVEQAQTKNFTSYDHFVELCQANEIYEESAQHTLISFLHELGIVTHFDQPWLRETNVINPRWLTEAVYKLVTAKQAINGKLPRTELTQLLDSKVYPSRKHDYLIGLIERFELCYRFDENTLLFPELLQHDEPNLTELHQQIQQVDTLHFILLYSEFLPKSIFTRFVVRSQRYIDKNYLWKTGVVLRDLHKQTTALVQLDEKSQKVTLHLMGTHKQDFLAVLLFLLRDIHNSFPRLHVDERLALPDNPVITVSYNDLLERLQEGETEIRPEGAKQKYNIRQLLGTAYHSKPTEAEIMAFLRTLIDSQTIPDEKTFWQKFKDSIELKIPFGIGSIDLKGLVRAAFKK